MTSPCAIVAAADGYTANVQKLMSSLHQFNYWTGVLTAAGASSGKGNQAGFMHEFALRAKNLEINPRSPLIKGLLHRVEQLASEDETKDHEAEEELKEVASILIDGALVRSGFEVPDSNG